MVGGMGRGEAFATTAFNKQTHIFGQIRVVAGAESAHKWLDEAAADHVGASKGEQHQCHHHPAFFAKIDGEPSNEKHVQRSPKVHVARGWQQGIEQRVRQTAVNEQEQLLVELQQLVHRLRAMKMQRGLSGCGASNA